MKCQTCGKSDESEENPMLLCDFCDEGGAHIKCCGFDKVPDGDWLARKRGAAPPRADALQATTLFSPASLYS